MMDIMELVSNPDVLGALEAEAQRDIMSEAGRVVAYVRAKGYILEAAAKIKALEGVVEDATAARDKLDAQYEKERVKIAGLRFELDKAGPQVAKEEQSRLQDSIRAAERQRSDTGAYLTTKRNTANSAARDLFLMRQALERLEVIAEPVTPALDVLRGVLTGV